jgi:hypothetical protein
MLEMLSVLVDELDVDEFSVDDFETTELPVPVTDQATATAEPLATVTPPENFPNTRNPGIEAFLYMGDPIYDPNAEPLYVRPRSYAPKLHPFPPRDQVK